MYTTGLALTTLLALTASAKPHQHHQHRHAHERRALNQRRDETFNIHLYNNCSVKKSFAVYQLSTADWTVSEVTTPVDVAAGDSTVIQAPYTETTLRLSGNADWGCDGQWDAQALFEFGYSAWGSVEGTAYDLSLMEGADSSVGISASPISNGQGSETCESKFCQSPTDCALAQGWTNEDQVNDGSPADTVCYKGKTDFLVTFCP